VHDILHKIVKILGDLADEFTGALRVFEDFGGVKGTLRDFGGFVLKGVNGVEWVSHNKLLNTIHIMSQTCIYDPHPSPMLEVPTRVPC
jgi:hypothetical protein